MLDVNVLPLAHLAIATLPILLAQDTAPVPETAPVPDFSAYQTPEFNAATSTGYLIGYLIFSFLTWKIYQRCGVENAWFAWIPILGTYINFVAGDEDNPILWTILMFIPCINIIAVIWLIKAWIRICRKLEKSPWLLLLWLVPCIGNLIFYSYLAFG